MGVRIVNLAETGKSKYLRSLPLRRLLKSEKVDVLHSHGTAALTEASVGSVFLKSIRHVHTFHYGNYPAINSRDRRFESLMWRFPDALIAVGYSQKAALIKTFGIPDSGIQVIHNGVGEAIPAPDDRIVALKKPGRILIGSVSTLIRQKGLEHLLDSLSLLVAENCPVELAIVGDGELRKPLEKRAEDLGISERVHFVGWVPNARDTVLPALDIFVQSSMWEAMSVVLLEACSRGIPIVATNVGDNARVIDHARTGYIVPPGDGQALADAIKKLAMNSALRSQFGQNAFEVYSREFTAKSMTSRYMEIYEGMAR